MYSLEMKQVSKRYSSSKKQTTIALNNVDLTLTEGEFLGIMGTSGSGKTTLLNVASGIDRCDNGEICIGGIDISAMDKNELSLFRRSNIGMVFQDFNLIISFADWRNSSEIVDDVWNRLLNQNNMDKNDFQNTHYFKISSKVEAYDRANNSCRLLIFVFLYLGVLLYLSFIVMIHYKLRIEHENDKRIFRSLYRIGMQDVEIKNIIKKKILVVFFVSAVYALLLNLVFSFNIYNSYDDGLMGVVYTAAVSGVFFFVNLLFYKLYADHYSKDAAAEIYGGG